MQDGAAVLRVRQLQGRPRAGAEEAPQGSVPQIHHRLPVGLLHRLPRESRIISCLRAAFDVG